MGGLDHPEISQAGQLESLSKVQPQNYSDVASVLHNMAARMGSVQVDSYFRAGRAYFTVNHKMGQAGNMFFKTAFENLLKHSNEKPHVTTEQNSICVIFRI